MNNRGFTLIELTAVIVVLAVIFLVSFPSIVNMTKAEKENEYNDMVEDLCLAGKSYIYANMGVFPELSTIGSKINIDIKELILYGNVDDDIVNAKTNKLVENDSLTYTVLSDHSLDCKYNENE